MVIRCGGMKKPSTRDGWLVTIAAETAPRRAAVGSNPPNDRPGRTPGAVRFSLLAVDGTPSQHGLFEHRPGQGTELLFRQLVRGERLTVLGRPVRRVLVTAADGGGLCDGRLNQSLAGRSLSRLHQLLNELGALG